MRTTRMEAMEEYIHAKKSVSLDELCEKFHISKNTIRRDIDELLQKGTIQKVYGGVTSTISGERQALLSFEQRGVCRTAEKDRICQAAACFVRENDVIYIDTGTTCLHLVDYLPQVHCTILTNSLQICARAVSHPSLQIICLPGMLKRETLSFVGSEVTDYLKKFNIGKAFLTATGVTLENGLTNASMEEYMVKHAVTANSQEHILLADHTKFGKISLMTYCAFADLQHIVTDRPPAGPYAEYCREQDIQLHIADSPQNTRQAPHV